MPGAIPGPQQPNAPHLALQAYLTLYYTRLSHGKLRRMLDANDLRLLDPSLRERIQNRFPAQFILASVFLQKLKAYNEKGGQRDKITAVSPADSQYPPELFSLTNFPFVLFLKGNPGLLKEPKLSIVGTRKPCLFSVFMGGAIARFVTTAPSNMPPFPETYPLTERPVVSVSGMANGIDNIVHNNSLNSGTIGVLACGFNHLTYRQRAFYRMAAQNGKILLLSEHPPDVSARSYFFPKRNRIISALGDGLFFICGGLKSGALISAEYSYKLKKPLFYVQFKEQKNNLGAARLAAMGAQNVSKNFPYKIRTRLTMKDNEVFFIGSGRWLIINAHNFQKLSFSPAPQGRLFPE